MPARLGVALLPAPVADDRDLVLARRRRDCGRGLVRLSLLAGGRCVPPLLLALLAASAVALEAALGAALSATFPALVALVALLLLLRVECAVARPTGERIGGISKLVKTARAVRGDLAACATQCDSTALHKLELVFAAAFPAAIAAAFLAKIVVVLAVATAVAPHGARALPLVVVRVLFLTQRG